MAWTAEAKKRREGKKWNYNPKSITPRRDHYTKEELKARTVENENGCWIWQGARASAYGCIRSKNIGYRLVHRYSKVIFEGLPMEILDDPSNVFMHHCDTPLCINPTHLTLSSQTENVADAVRKGKYKKKCGGHDVGES